MFITRPAAVAGSFYPLSANVLRHDVLEFLAHARLSANPNLPAPKAIVVPHAGYIYSGPIAASAFITLEPAHASIRRVVLLGPCHRVPVAGLALSAADGFETPLGTVPIDHSLDAAVLALPQVEIYDATHLQEHALEVQLPFLQTVLDDFALIPIVVGAAAPETVARVIDHLWGGPETLIVISTDLSHYLDQPSAHRVDEQTCHAIEDMALEDIEDHQACGRYALKGMLFAARERHMRITTLDLRNSADTAGNPSQVVGYGAWRLDDGNASQTEAIS